MEIAATVIPITAILAVLTVFAVRSVRHHELADGRAHLWAVACIGWGIPVAIVWYQLLMAYGT